MEWGRPVEVVRVGDSARGMEKRVEKGVGQGVAVSESGVSTTVVAMREGNIWKEGCGEDWRRRGIIVGLDGVEDGSTNVVMDIDEVPDAEGDANWTEEGITEVEDVPEGAGGETCVGEGDGRFGCTVTSTSATDAIGDGDKLGDGELVGFFDGMVFFFGGVSFLSAAFAGLDSSKCFDTARCCCLFSRSKHLFHTAASAHIIARFMPFKNASTCGFISACGLSCHLELFELRCHSANNGHIFSASTGASPLRAKLVTCGNTLHTSKCACAGQFPRRGAHNVGALAACVPDKASYSDSFTPIGMQSQHCSQTAYKK